MYSSPTLYSSYVPDVNNWSDETFPKPTKLCHKTRTSDLEYRGTSRMRNRAPLGPYSRTMPRAVCKS